MKAFITSLLLTFFLASCANEEVKRNYPDAVDANNTPSYLEEREDEYINSSDMIDNNQVPAALEEREEKEEQGGMEEQEHEDHLDDEVYWENDEEMEIFE